MYIKRTWKCGNTVEVKKTYSARYGRKIARSGNTLETSKAQKTVNINKAIAELRRILNANFMPGSWHCVFTYPQKKAPTPEEAARDREKILRRVRKVYRESNVELKTVSVTEYTNRRIHHHIVMTDLGHSMRAVKRIWREIIAETYYTAEERAQGEPLHLVFPWSQLDESGQYGKLAEYLIKETAHSRDASGKQRRYSCSRNMIRPEPVVEIISASEWRREPPERKGYYIDKEFSYNGYSELTGLPIQETVYVGILPKRRKEAG